MKLYKITEQDHTTYEHSTKWGVGVAHKKRACKNPSLCSSDVLHAYKSKELALLLNPAHANVRNPVLWDAAGRVVVSDYGKVGVFELTTTKEIRLPEWYTDKAQLKRVQVMFAILCAEAVLVHFEKFAPKDDRPRKAIEAAREYLRSPNTRADAAYAVARADAAYAAAAAARAAAAADAAADAAYAAAAAADAAYAAAAAAAAAADAAYAADLIRKRIPFKLIQEAMI